MRLTRCFSPVPLGSGTVITLPPAAGAHLTRVLRLRAGAALTLFDGRGGEYAARLLETTREGLRVAVGVFDPIERESPRTVRLLQCLARGERMDWTLQKATELGVTSIRPVRSEHSVVQLKEEDERRRLEHWRAVTIAACEQCGRNRLPTLEPLASLAQACNAVQSEATTVGLLLSPAANRSLPEALAAADGGAVSLLVGPEGGLSDGEEAQARRCGFQAVRLGPRVLRTETAPLAALAAIQALSGDFR